MKERELFEHLGLTPELTEEEARQRCQALQDFLAPDRVPLSLAQWAAGERKLAERAYLALSRVEEAEEEEEEEKAPEQRGQRPQAVYQAALRLSQSPVGLVLIGAVIGLLIVGGVFWTRRGSEEGTPSRSALNPDASRQGTFDPARFFDSQQGRIAELRKTVEANPKDTAALFELGEVHIISEKWQEALDWFTRLVAVEPTNLHAITDIGTAQYNLGRHAEAAQTWEKGMAMDPNDPQLHYNLGFLYAFSPEVQDLEKGKAHWQEVIRLAPDSTLAQTVRVHLEQFGGGR